jgi:hypothetical protein
MSDSPLIDVMIPTFNEEGQIREAIEHARRVGPVFVLDSCSTDRTRAIAQEAGATVVEHAFENFSKQKNWGLDNLPLTAPWVLVLDADERVTPSLADELRRIAQDPSSAAAYFTRQIVVFMGRQIRHGGYFPRGKVAFFRHGVCRYEDRAVHERLMCATPVGRCKNPIVHIRRETISQFIAKLIRYADLESDQLLQASGTVGAGPGSPPPRAPGGGEPLRHRSAPGVPFSPLWRFLRMYILRLGFLDGAAGWHLASLMASAEYMFRLLYREKINRLTFGPEGSQTTPPPSPPRS